MKKLKEIYQDYKLTILVGSFTLIFIIITTMMLTEDFYMSDNAYKLISIVFILADFILSFCAYMMYEYERFECS